MLSQVKNESIYIAIQELHDEKAFPIIELCEFASIARSAYYKWLNRNESSNEQFNQELLPLIKNAYEEKQGILGYRQMTIKLNREHEFHVNSKRIYRLMSILNLKSVCRKKKKNYKKTTPQVTAENTLNRNFNSDKFGEKWFTDVTEMKYGIGGKAYLSAILDLADKSIVSFVIGHSNNNTLVFKTFDIAHEQHPDAKPLFHSDRGFQYTSKNFKKKLDDADMTQSMSRVSRCIDNGPMEAFWGMLKSEMYYLRKFNSYSELESVITDYINYYNNQRYQKRLKCMTPLEYREYLKSVA
ncbi:IS3 family transposase [Clostridium botulinum]|uniref:IS3 family transposase n=1 Tax=Clostridium botulinum TaxID=1491 RepID=UPI0009ABE2CF|nr:IS3 family transposase [Clostridium botulinum]AXG97504.1 IS3 family transposase [Clostridium botulinum]MBY6756068.1 IS3 family transposase [Clostridium botulinum]MBY6771099.1 IS3 family transposase [Clostridium botulinum]MBY6774792.1 IS3 family transposase [Clostridium botulinum]MBY6782116.1 IS3 family transposase [Clostridium botulinum]